MSTGGTYDISGQIISLLQEQGVSLTPDAESQLRERLVEDRTTIAPNLEQDLEPGTTKLAQTLKSITEDPQNVDGTTLEAALLSLCPGLWPFC